MERLIEYKRKIEKIRITSAITKQLKQRRTIILQNDNGTKTQRGGSQLIVDSKTQKAIDDRLNATISLFEDRITQFKNRLVGYETLASSFTGVDPCIKQCLEGFTQFATDIGISDDLVLLHLNQQCPNLISDNELLGYLPKLWETTDITTNLYGLNVLTNTVTNPPMVYFPNLSSKTLFAINEEPRLSHNPISVVRKGVARAVTTNQLFTRFGRLPRQIAAMIYIRQKISAADCGLTDGDKFDQGRKFGLELIGIQMIRAILNKIGIIPFNHGAFGVHPRLREIEYPTNLPIVIGILLNLAANEFFNNLSRDSCLLYLKNLNVWCDGSLFDNALKTKSANRAIMKNLVEEAGPKMVKKFSRAGRAMQKDEVSERPEFWQTDTEKSEGKEKFLLEADPGSVAYYNKTARFRGTPAQNTRHLIRRWHTLNLLSTPSCYYHGSTATAIPKSMAPKVTTLPYNVKVKSTVEINSRNYDYEIDYKKGAEAYRLGRQWIENELKPLFDAHYRKHRDLESWFVDSLTSNSQGEKIPKDQLPEGTISEALLNMSQSRIIHFLWNEQKFSNLDDLLTEMNKPGVIGTRAQIDRRFRIIFMVNNATQVISFSTLVVMNTVKPFLPSVAVGKQVGNILDMWEQIQNTNGDSIVNSMDVSGMDTHTLKHQQEYIRQAMLLCFEGHEVRNYFAFTELQVSSWNLITDQPITANLNAMQSALTLGTRLNVQAGSKGKDRLMGLDLIISAEAFASGLFGTTGQHTILLTSVLEGIYNKYGVTANTYHFDMILKILGDDIFQVLQDGSFRFTDAEARAYFENQKKLLAEINYVIEISASRYYGVFLQMDALCGTFLPSPHRMSLFMDERGGTNVRHPVERVRVYSQLVKTFANRSYGEDNYASFMYGVANVVRGIYVDKKTWSKTKNLEKWKKYCVPVRNEILFVMPISYCWTPSIRLPLPVLSFRGDGEVTSVLGESCYVIPGSSAYMTITRNYKKPDSQIPEKIFKIDDFLKVAEMENDDILTGLFLGMWNQNQVLTETRKAAVGPENLLRMTSQLEGYQQTNLRLDSYVGYRDLVARKLRIPEHLVYYLQPQYRIESAVLERKTTQTEQIELKNAMIPYLTKFDKWVASKKLLNQLLFGLVKVVDTGISIVNPGLYEMGLPLSPKYHENSDARALYRVMGPVFSNSSASTLVGIGKYFSQYSKSAQSLQEVTEVGARVYKKGGAEAVENYLKALAIDPYAYAKLTQAFVELSKENPVTPVQAIQENNFWHAISFSVVEPKRMFIYEVGQSISRRTDTVIRDFCSIFMRDLIASQPKIYNTRDTILKLLPHPSVVATLTKKT